MYLFGEFGWKAFQDNMVKILKDFPSIFRAPTIRVSDRKMDSFIKFFIAIFFDPDLFDQRFLQQPRI